jgi:hypothetical protein
VKTEIFFEQFLKHLKKFKNFTFSEIIPASRKREKGKAGL